MHFNGNRPAGTGWVRDHLSGMLPWPITSIQDWYCSSGGCLLGRSCLVVPEDDAV